MQPVRKAAEQTSAKVVFWTKYKGMVENATDGKGADITETVETEESGQHAEEAAGTVAEDTTDEQPAVSPMARRRGRRFY